MAELALPPGGRAVLNEVCGRYKSACFLFRHAAPRNQHPRNRVSSRRLREIDPASGVRWRLRRRTWHSGIVPQCYPTCSPQRDSSMAGRRFSAAGGRLPIWHGAGGFKIKFIHSPFLPSSLERRSYSAVAPCHALCHVPCSSPTNFQLVYFGVCGASLLARRHEPGFHSFAITITFRALLPPFIPLLLPPCGASPQQHAQFR